MTQTQRYCYPGALHIHSEYSHDCTGRIDTIVTAAQQAGLRWIILTDHDTLGGRAYEGWHGNVLLLVGHEITPPHNHFLAIDTDYVVNYQQPPQAVINEVYHAGGFGIIAHPDDRVINALRQVCYTWDDWTIDSPSIATERTMGIELWNFMSDWSTQLTRWNKYVLAFFPMRGVRGPTPDTLRWWDALNRSGTRTFGVAGVDAHATPRRVPWGTIEIFPYQWMFRTLTNYVLLDAPLSPDVAVATAKQQLFGAMQRGALFIVNRVYGDGDDITITLSRGTTQWHLGDTVSLQQGSLKLVADVGRTATVRLIHNGSLAAVATRTLCVCIKKPGVYRVEAVHPLGTPWLFSNHFFVEE